jgi:hypothetical protein
LEFKDGLKEGNNMKKGGANRKNTPSCFLGRKKLMEQRQGQF